MSEYKLVLLITGIALLGAAWLPRLLARGALTFPIVYTVLGLLLYAVGLPLPGTDPVRNGLAVERLSEITVLVALLGAGIRIDTRFGWRRWAVTWRLLAVAMPVTIVACTWLGHGVLGYGFATAALLGAVLAPTDPVLASDLQVHGPGEGGEDPVRFGLTSEAGLNDALAFPFVWLAIAFAAAGPGAAADIDWARWLGIDVAWRLGGALLVGWTIGYGLMHLLFRVEREDAPSRTGDGLVALAIVLIVYGVAEVLQTYGFLAVFVAALVIRHHEREHAYHGILNLFAEQVERLLMALLLIGLGGAVATGVLDALTWREWVVALLVVVVVRPLAGWIGLLGSTLRRDERWAIAVFGVRGIGSFYYLAFALNHGSFDRERSLWSVVTLVVLLSILLHGLTAKRALAQVDRWRAYRSRRRLARKKDG